MGEAQFNPRRQYHGFRPRQAARGQGSISGVVNRPTVSLFNNSTGPYVIMVRWFSWIPVSNQLLITGYLQGTPPGTLQTVVPLVPGDATPTGQIFASDSATLITTDFTWQGQVNFPVVYPATFPLAVLLPGWAWITQGPAAATPWTVGFFWEWIAIDELDYI